jgi:glutathione S-transferase
MFGLITSDVKVLAVCSAVLYVKFLGTTMIQGRKGFHAGSRLKEDTGLFCAGGMPKQESYGAVQAVPAHLKPAFEDELRWKRIVQNDLESIPLSLVVFMASMAAGGDQRTNGWLLITYTVARVAHTYTYANQLQPHRMFAWMGGVFCVLAAAANGAFSAIYA